MKCPTCFTPLATASATFVCVGSCPPTPSPRAGSVLGYATSLKPMFEQPMDALFHGIYPPCPTCREISEQEVCGACGEEIPKFWRQALVTCVAMAGARATGKSLMVAVAKEQLALLVERHHRSTLTLLGDTEAFFDQHYAAQLYDQRQLLNSTARLEDPATAARGSLMLQFTERLSDEVSRRRILVLRDVAGEDLESRQSDGQLSFFRRADAVVAMIDPLAVRQIRDMLMDLIPGDTRVSDGDVPAVLNYVLDLMTGHDVSTPTPIPLAVVLSKFDTLQALREVEATEWQAIMNRPGSPVQRDPSLAAPGYDLDDGDLLDAEVRGMLDRLNAGQLAAILDERALRYRFFAASALGASPEGNLIHAGGIAPFRALDPFKWALAVTA